MFTDVKSIFATKTFWGALIAVVPSVLGMFGYTVTGDDATHVVTMGTTLVNDGVTLIGAVIAIWGRMTAAKTATLTGK